MTTWKVVGSGLLSGLLFYLGTGLHPWGLLAWIAPLPVMAAALRSSWRQAFLAGALASALGGLNVASYLTTFVPPLVAALYVLSQALAFACCLLAGRWAALSLGRW